MVSGAVPMVIDGKREFKGVRSRRGRMFERCKKSSAVRRRGDMMTRLTVGDDDVSPLPTPFAVCLGFREEQPKAVGAPHDVGVGRGGDVFTAEAAVEHEREDARENKVIHRDGHPMCADGEVSEEALHGYDMVACDGELGHVGLSQAATSSGFDILDRGMVAGIL